MPFLYPTNSELREIEPDLVQRAGRAGRLGLDIMPPQDSNFAKVRWTQEDNYHGLQHMRGLDGAPTRVSRVGEKMYEYEPGVFGEFIQLAETELTTRAGTMDLASTPIRIDDLVMRGKKYLLAREFDRMESSIWTLLLTGVLNIVLDGPNGTQFGYRDQYTIQTYTAPVPWTTLATAAPVANLQSVQQLGLAAGHSTDFGAAAMMYMNTFTSNQLINNRNANDLFGFRLSTGGTSNNSIPAVQNLLTGMNLPKITAYDGGYLPTVNGVAGPFTKFIPNGKVIVIGQRPGNAQIGNYLLTRNMVKGGAPGSYDFIRDTINGQNAEKKVPPSIEVHRGHNGGPAIYYPSAVLVMTVF